jgi:hypothetical protein
VGASFVEWTVLVGVASVRLVCPGGVPVADAVGAGAVAALKPSRPLDE